MFRSRWSRALALLVLLFGTLYVVASLYLPSSRRLIVGIDKRTGKVRLVQSHITFLPPTQFYRLDFERRDGWAQKDGFVRIESAEQIPVTIDYRLRFGITGDTLPDARTLVQQGWSAWVGRRVAEAMNAVTQHVPIEELLAPNSRFYTERDPLKRAVTAYLAQSGLKVTAFEIARIEADHEALLRVKRAELRREARGVAGRVAIFAIDGADWDLLSELSNDGNIPNLKALAKGGVTGSVQTIQPTVSPMLWTTVATGLPPDRHGVLDFVDHNRKAPVDAYTRRAPALWDIAEAFGRHSMVVNWWTAWPPTSADTFTYDVPVELQTAAIQPEKYAARVRQLAIPPQSVGYQQMRRFLTLTPAEFDKVTDERDPANIFRNVLAKSWSDHRAAINLYNEQQPLVFMMSYDGTDAVNHLFAPFHPPYRQGVSSDDYRKYWAAVTTYYTEVDRMMGEWMQVLPADTTVIVMSAYGFKWGKTRPTAIPNGSAALSDHRNPGMFIAYGNHVVKGGGTHSLTLYDIAPTVLAILGLPQSAEMPGHVLTWAFNNITPVQTVHVVSYSEFMNTRPVQPSASVEPRRYQADLQAIGHLSDPSRNLTPQLEDQDDQTADNNATPLPPDVWGRYAYLNNTGIELLKQKKAGDAIDAFGQAIELNPRRATPHLNLAMALLERQQYTAADAEFLKAVAANLPNSEQWFVDYAAWYRDHDMATRAIVVLSKGKELFPQSFVIASNLGATLLAADRLTEGVPELERALGLQPSSTLALNNLGTFYAKHNDYARALDFWNRSLAIDARQPQVRAAAEAARTRL
jgi:predicted AlkP superfamily phosphohydrolase/phosphomutase/Tfp pilus assembly protein PilF